MQHHSDWLEYVEMVLSHWMTWQRVTSSALSQGLCLLGFPRLNLGPNHSEEKEGVLGLYENSFMFRPLRTLKKKKKNVTFHVLHSFKLKSFNILNLRIETRPIEFDQKVLVF